MRPKIVARKAITWTSMPAVTSTRKLKRVRSDRENKFFRINLNVLFTCSFGSLSNIDPLPDPFHMMDAFIHQISITRGNFP
jgi:hypothetical protein